MSRTRRDFLGTAALAGAATLINPLETFAGRFSLETLAQTRRGRRVFLHGVASGDPLSQAVILWTRVTPPPGRATVPVSFEIARDAGFTRIAGRGMQMTSAARDFTVKVDAIGLEPGATYFYRFSALGEASPVGRTRTLPVSTSRVRLAVASCSNLPFGYFNAYARIAARQDLDAVLHLGDYIYEYRNAQYGDGTPFGRIPQPDKEITTLEDYRTRHAQYRTDPDLQEAHRLHPWIVVWDDHEFANNTWRDGAANHNPDRGEGPWPPRRDAAIQAYSEWMPIRDDRSSRQTRIYRSFAFGQLADLVMLDTRFVGRDQEAPKREQVDVIDDPKRSLLGVAQEQWLFDELKASTGAGVTWQLLGQQIKFAPQSLKGARSESTDHWDGYRPARERVMDFLEASRIRNTVILTGDIHSSWAYDVARDPWNQYDARTGRGTLAVEVITPAITSPGWATREPEKGPARAQEYLNARPHLKWVEGVHRGYMVVELTPKQMRTDWYFVPTVTEKNATETLAKSFVSEAGSPRLMQA